MSIDHTPELRGNGGTDHRAKATASAPPGAAAAGLDEQGQALLAAIIESSEDAIVSKTLDGVITSWNRGAERLFGYGADEAVGRSILLIIPDDRRDEERMILDRLRRGERLESYETTRVARDGTFLEVSLTVSPIRDREGRVIGASKIARDIRRRRRAEEQAAAATAALRQRIEELQTLLDVLPVGVFIARDRSCTEITMNPSGARMLGLQLGANASKTGPTGAALPFKVMKDGVEADAGDLPMQRAARDDVFVDGEEVDVIRADGTSVRLYEYASPLHDVDGAVRGVLGAFVDITELRHAQQALRESEERFRHLADAMPQLVWSAGADGTIDYCNGRVREFAGIERHAERGEWATLAAIHVADRRRTLAAWRRSVRRRQPFEVEHRLRTAAGAYRWFLSRAMPSRDAEGRLLRWYGTATEIHDRKIAEERLEQAVRERTRELEQSHHRLRMSERMAALGTLSAGIGHDLSNLLLPVRIRLDSIEAGSRSLPEDVQAIRKALEYLTQLATGLRLLVREPEAGADGRESVLLEQWWKQVGGLMRNPLPRSVALEISIDEHTPRVRMSAAALTQSVFNLVQNAADALRDREHGTIRIEARPATSAGRVLLSVSDDGPGMTPDVLQRCMEPYFTTKARRLSTGMGLSLVQGLVQRAGGAVEVCSEPERGTCFMLTLPASEQCEEAGDSSLRHAVVTIGDARASSCLRTVLRRAGYDVNGADEPSEQTRLWVADGAHDADELRSFLDGRTDRRVAIFGATPPGLNDDRIVELPRTLSPRVQLDEIAKLEG